MKCVYLSSMVAIMLVMLWGCQKENEPQFDLAAPSINIVQPIADENYSAGQEVLLYVEFSENQELHDYSIVIRNADRSFTKTIVEGHSHNRIYVVDTNFVLPENHNQTYTITVKATDHNENLASEQILLFVP